METFTFITLLFDAMLRVSVPLVLAAMAGLFAERSIQLNVTVDDRLPPIHEAEKYRVTDLGAGDAAAIERAADLLVGAQKIYVHAGIDNCSRKILA